MDTLNLNELAELLLVASYEETEALGHANFFLSIEEIAINLGIENREQIIDACHLLEEKGLILLVFDHATALSATMTPAGEAYVEEGGETGIIGEYRRYRSLAAARDPDIADSAFPSEIQPLSSFELPAPAQSPQPPVHQEGIGHIIASMEMLVRNDPSLSENLKKDLAVDIRTLELQLSRSCLNRPVIDVISTGLKEAATLAPLVDLLLSMKPAP